MTTPIEFHKMKQRRGTAGAWSAYNPVMLAGELGLELDNDGKVTGIKAGDGDGDLRWSELPYVVDALTNMQLPVVDAGMNNKLAKFLFRAGTPYGDKSEGNVTISGADTVINHYATLSGDVGPGSRTIPLAALPVEFTVGDLVLIHQALNWRFHEGGLVDEYASTNIGRFEYAHIAAIDGLDVTVQLPIRSSYLSDGVITGGDETYRSVAQMVRIPQYDELTLTGSIACDPWTGELGGIAALFADRVTGAGDINTANQGYRGVEAVTDDTAYWTEGYSGWSTIANPMADPEKYGAVRAYIESAGGAADTQGGSGNTQGYGILNTSLEPIVPYVNAFPEAETVEGTAVFGTGCATADGATPAMAGGGCIIAAVRDVLSWTGEVAAADGAGGSGSIMLYSDDVFPGTINVVPDPGAYAVYGGNGQSLNIPRFEYDDATLVEGPSVVQALVSPGSADEVASTYALIQYLSGISGFDSMLFGVVQDIELTETGNHTIITTPADKWTQPDMLHLFIQAGSGPKTAPSLRLKAGSVTIDSILVPGQDNAFTGLVQSFELNDDMIDPSTDLILEVVSASTNDQYLVTAVLIGNTVNYPDIFGVVDDRFLDTGAPGAEWTVDNANGIVVVDSTPELSMAPTLGASAVECGVIAAEAFSMTDFTFSTTYNHPAWSGTNPGSGLRGLIAKLPSVVHVSHLYDEDAGTLIIRAAWQDGSAQVDDSAALPTDATAIRVSRRSGTVDVEYYTTAWNTLVSKAVAAPLTAMQVKAFQSNLATAGHTSKVEGILLRNG